MLQVRENISLAKYSFYRTGGAARYFVEINRAEDFVELKQVLNSLNVADVIIVGIGSNILFSDAGWDGLVVKNNYNRLEKQIDGSWLIGSGLALPLAARFVAKEGYRGLERLANVPGSVGGAIRGNAEAWKQSISDSIREVVWYDWDLGEKRVEKKDCQFKYRSSIFKVSKEYRRGLIKEAIFDFKVGDAIELMTIIDSDKNNRQKNQPDLPSCGCFFKNVLLNQKNWKNIEEKMGTLVLKDRKVGDYFSAGRIIDWCGYKGLCVGGACVSEVHANFIVNKDQATSMDIFCLFQTVQRGVKEKIGLDLEPEVQIYGKFA